MTTLTEGARAAAFILSEANGMRSRAAGTVKSGEVLSAGQLVKADGAELVAYTDGATPLGVLIYNVDATDGAVAHCAYIARDAEVNGNMIVYPAENSAGTVESTAITALAALGIIVR